MQVLTVLQRRYYTPKTRDLLPFHHQPTTRVNGETMSTSFLQVYDDIEAHIKHLVNTSLRTGVDKGPEIRRLQNVGQFVQDTDTLPSYDWSPHPRSLEDRMEDLLKDYGYDKMKPATRPWKGKGKGKEKAR